MNHIHAEVTKDSGPVQLGEGERGEGKEGVGRGSGPGTCGVQNIYFYIGLFFFISWFMDPPTQISAF